MKDFEECKGCEAKHVDEFCAKCNGSFYYTLLDHYCSSCHGSQEALCRSVLKNSKFCIQDGATLHGPYTVIKRNYISNNELQ